MRLLSVILTILVSSCYYIKQSPRKVSFDSSMLLKNTGNKVQLVIVNFQTSKIQCTY